jgi:hypothetical protein
MKSMNMLQEYSVRHINIIVFAILSVTIAAAK